MRTPTLRALLILSLLVFPSACSRKSKAPAEEKALAASEKREANVAIDSGCPHQENGSCDHGDKAAPSQPNRGSGARLYGAALGDSPEITLAQLVNSPDKFHNQHIKVEGHVRRVCAKKGCWMEISSSSSDQSPGFRVTFKDYAFLVPVDSKGSEARLEGLVQITKVKKAAVDHYESEGATFPGKEADGTAREVRLVATGVELLKS